MHVEAHVSETITLNLAHVNRMSREVEEVVRDDQGQLAGNVYDFAG